MKLAHFTCRVLLIAFGLAAGCATGRSDFRVIQITPVIEVPAPMPTPVTESVPAPATASSADGTAETSATPLTVRVRPGDCLWNLSRHWLGDPRRYPEIAALNHLPNPDRIYPEQELRLPEGPVAAPSVSTLVSSARTPRAAATPAGKPSPTTVAFPDRPNRAFGPGEQLWFSVDYFGISAGLATLSVNTGPAIAGRPTFHLVAEARTHPAFEWLFKVRDRIESVFDARGLFSWHYEKNLQEGNYTNRAKLIYDQAAGVVRQENGQTAPLPPLAQDVLSEFYYFRTLDLTPGSEVRFPVVADNAKIYELRVEVLGRERICVPAGTFDCLKVEPYLMFEGLFQHKGKLHIWVTDDARRVPVLIKSQIAIGTIDIVLRNAVAVDVESSGPRN